MCGDGVDAKGLGGVSSTVGKADNRDSGDTWDGRGVGIPPGGCNDRSHVTSSHRIVHQ